MSLWWNLIVAEKIANLKAHMKEGKTSYSSWAQDTSCSECLVCVHQDLSPPEAFPEWCCIIQMKFLYDAFPKGILKCSITKLEVYSLCIAFSGKRDKNGPVLEILAYADRGKDKVDSSIFSFSWSDDLTQSPSFRQQLRHSQAQILTSDRFQRMKRAGWC